MVILKTLRASTLMETLVASVLIVVVFMISSMILNNLFANSTKSNMRNIEAHMNELHYLYLNDRLTLPYFDDFKTWDIAVTTFMEQGKSVVAFEASNTEADQNYLKQIDAE